MPRVRILDSIIDAFNVNPRKLCQCGRRSEFVHCPHCGSTNFYGLSEKSKKAMVFDPEGNELSVRVFACKACLRNFMENECTTTCKAMPTAAQERENTIATKAASAPLTEQGKELLRGLAKLRKDKAPAIAQRLNEAGPGLLERVDMLRGSEEVVETERDKELVAKLLEPPKLNEGGES